MTSFTTSSFELIERFEGVRDLGALEMDLAAHFALLGIEHFVICRVPPPGQEKLAPLFLVDRWPKEWLRYYDEQRFVRHDPITARLLSSFDPFSWSDVAVDRRDHPVAYRIMCEAAEIGMVEGYSIPISDPKGFQGCISLCGPKLDLSAEDKRALHMVSLFAHGTAERLHDLAQRSEEAPLTEREREVLRWLAVGKRQAEIGILLGISERTVEAHLQHARRKLGTSNAVHTAVVALQRREIRL